MYKIDLKLFELELWFRRLFGQKYLVNLNPKSKEIHRIYGKNRCKFLPSITHKKYVGINGMKEILDDKPGGYNGCYLCLREFDMDKRTMDKK